MLSILLLGDRNVASTSSEGGGGVGRVCEGG